MPLFDSTLIVQPTSQKPQIVSVASSSHGWWAKCRSVSAPTGQTAMHMPQRVQSGVVQALAEGRGDRRFHAAVRRLDRGDADHLVADPRAAVAHDAAVPLVIDDVAEVDIGLREFRATIRVGVDVVQVGVVLQIALARFVAGRAVERVVDQVHLKDELACIDARLGVGEDFHSLAERRRARLDQSAAFAENFDRANAAGSPWAQQWLIAEIGNFDARHRAPLRESSSRPER